MRVGKRNRGELVHLAIYHLYVGEIDSRNRAAGGPLRTSDCGVAGADEVVCPGARSRHAGDRLSPDPAAQQGSDHYYGLIDAPGAQNRQAIATPLAGPAGSPVYVEARPRQTAPNGVGPDLARKNFVLPREAGTAAGTVIGRPVAERQDRARAVGTARSTHRPASRMVWGRRPPTEPHHAPAS
jgi:hypothetical protein